MSRFFRSLFALGTVLAAAAMLFTATQLIRKNSPKPMSREVRKLPATSPALAVSTQEPGSGSFIGGVGIIEPVGEATVIGSQLPGVVEEVCVLPGTIVKKGDVLLRLDRRSAMADVQVAEADLKAQQAKLAELLGQVDVARARVEAAEALVEQARSTERNSKREYDRTQAIGKYALSEEEVDMRRVNWETAAAKLHEANAKMHEAKASLALLDGQPTSATLEVQRAVVAQSEANLQRARTNLELREITAPKNATVLSVKIREGEFVPASVLSTPLLTLGVIDPLHVRVDIDESEIPRFNKAAKAYASVRGRPDIKVPMQLVRIEPLVIPKKSLTGTVSERVDTRVLQVIYSVDPQAIGASVGQQVDVYIEERA